MTCVKCGREFSDKVWRVHKGRCNGKEKKEQTIQAEAKAISGGIDDIEIVDDMSKAELIEIAGSFGVEIDKRWSKTRIAEALNG